MADHSTPIWPDDGNQQCFIYQLKPGAGAEYDRLHANTFPEVLAGLKARGAYDYSIFRRDDLVITVVRKLPGSGEIDADVARSEAEALWSQTLAPLFESIADDNGNPLYAHRVFRLD